MEKGFKKNNKKNNKMKALFVTKKENSSICDSNINLNEETPEQNSLDYDIENYDIEKEEELDESLRKINKWTDGSVI